MDENTLISASLSRAMALCSGREYCIADIRSKLQLWGVGEADSGKIISTLVRENFINEKRYSQAFARDKFRYNKWGRIRIRAELKMKKIPEEIISETLSSLDENLYREILRNLLESHRKSIKSKNLYDLKGKLLRYGSSKGFESDLLYDILSGLE